MQKNNHKNLPQQIGDILPNFGYLNPNKLMTLPVSSTVDSMKILRENLIGTFSATDPSILLGYNIKENPDGAGEPMGLITFGCAATSTPIPSVQTATILCGGLSVLLYHFARVVELSESEFIQSAALTFLLRIAHTHSTLYTEFLRKDYICLIGPIIKSSKCIKGIYLLNSILEVACDQPVLTKRGDSFHVNATTTACIVYADLLVSIINRYSDWYTSSVSGSDIMEMLLATLQALVREKHPKQIQNIARLSRSGLVLALLHFCKFYLVGIPKPVQLSQHAATSLVNLVGIFAGAPPPSSLLDDIVKVLLLMHRPSDSFITHDRSKFYFLLTSMVLVKQKRMSLPLPTRRLSLSLRRERKKTTPIKNNKKALRSISLDQVSPTAPQSIKQNENVESVDLVVAAASKLDEVDGIENNTKLPLTQPCTSSEGRGSGDTGDKTNAELFSIKPDVGIETLVDYSRDSDRKTLHQLRAADTSKLDKALFQHVHNLSKQTRNTVGTKKRIVKRSTRQERIKTKSRTTTDSETDIDSRKKGKVYYISTIFGSTNR